jgi:hypothetical protein
MEPTIVDRYFYNTLETTFKKEIENSYQVKVSEVGIISGQLADLDNDGAVNDLAGTAILKIGRSFKSFIFLMRDDGSIRFLENNGSPFKPKEGLSILSCSNKPIACPDTMERARSQKQGAQFYLMEFDKKKPGLEIVIPRGDGVYSILNSLEVFLSK